jgi:hypothetical protein
MATNPINVASYSSSTYYFDPLLADECISMSAQLSSGQGVLKRGQVLCGWAVGTARNVALSTAGTAPTVCAILAQDIDTGSGGPVIGLVYVQGKFLVTGLTASANGMEVDSASLWNVGIYVLTVQQRSGLLIPWRSWPATPGVPLPQTLPPKEAREANKELVDSIRAAVEAQTGVLQPETPVRAGRPQDPAWAVAAFGERDPTNEQGARDQTAEESNSLRLQQRQAIDELTARHQKELGDLNRKLHEERAQSDKQAEDSLRQARQADAAKQPQPPGPPLFQRPLHEATPSPEHSRPLHEGTASPEHPPHANHAPKEPPPTPKK